MIVFTCNRSLVAALPTGDSKLLASQIRIKLRIEELEELQEIRKNLQSTHLDESGNNLDLNNLLDDLPNSKQTLSPRTKQRLAEMNMVSSISIHSFLLFQIKFKLVVYFFFV